MRIRAALLAAILLAALGVPSPGNAVCVGGPAPFCPKIPSNPTPAPCIGDGVSGQRVQAVYAYPSDEQDKDNNPQYDQVVRRDFNGADSILFAAGAKHLRYVCRNGILDIIHIQLSVAAADFTGGWNGTAMTGFQNALAAAGYSGQYHDYVGLLQGYPAGGGVGTSRNDDQPGPANVNNVGPQYALWGHPIGVLDYYYPSSAASLATHEILHSLGAVQLSAPHSTGEFHTWQGNDYIESCPNQGQCVTNCNQEVVDCKQDDYFNPLPAAGSYLATHWNVYNSGYLGI